ncbi:DUF2306 domain-containing protein [Mucilaginibacter ginsenosidivorans]|nr:DUF2306 domain-containing protein [Mucilaginibacter ginsenosidivorans]
METAKYIFKTTGIYLVLCVATFLMLLGIVRYIPMQDNIGFLKFKQDYIHIIPWKIAFYTHVFSVIFALLAGLTQFSSFILKEHRRVHKIMGKIYAYDILFINFPAAFIMAIYANGQLPGKTAFLVLDCLWFWFTYKAVAEVRRKNIKAHKEYMIRSYALTLSAVTLRTWKIIILGFVYVDPLHLYMIDAWMGFVPNLLLAEWLIRRKRAANKKAIALS